MPLALLDNNAVNNIVREREGSWSSLLTTLRYPGCPHILVLGKPVDELAPLLLHERSNDPEDIGYQIREFYLSGIKIRALKPPLERHHLEIDAAMDGRPRPLWNGLYSVSVTRDLLRYHLHRQESIEKTIELLKENKRARDEEHETKVAVLADAPPEFNMKEANIEWLINEAVRHRLREGRDRYEYRLPEDEAAWPESKRLPSFWYLWSITFAHRFLHLKEPKRVEREGDVSDIATYRDAAYSDILVTDDQKFTQCAAMCPEPKPRLMTLAKWAETLR